MKLQNGNLYLESNDCAECGMDVKSLTEARAKNRKCYEFMDDPDDRRKWLLKYESLKADKKELVTKRFGDPHEYMAKEPIRKMVVKDLKADDFYLSYRYDGDKMLPIETVRAYTAAASFLNMLLKAKENKKEIKKLLNLSIGDFWLKVIEIIEADRIDLPGTYKRLREKADEYQATGYPSLISRKYGNTNALKVSSELAEGLLLELISQPYHDDVVICRKYNEWAVKNDHKQVTPATIGNWRRDNEHLILGTREGNKKWYNVYGKQIMRERPSAPNLRWESDDNELDLYFLEVKKKEGKTIKNYFYRPVLYVVKDSFNDYPMGYAIGPTQSTELVKLAYLNAIHHVFELTGAWYLPHDLQTDRWGLDKDLSNDLACFYKSVCRVFMPAKPKNARSKFIEQSFGQQWHKLLKFYPNYSGHNVTAQSKLNEDHLQLQKPNFPTVDQAPHQVAQFINALRCTVDEEKNVSRQQQWKEAFLNSDLSKRQPISEMQMLQLFGTRHVVPNAMNPEYPNKVTNRGITPAINCVERIYEIPEDLYFTAVGRNVGVIYDPLDYSRILVTDGANLRFIAREYKKSPSATLDFQPGDRTLLNAREAEKMRLAALVATEKQSRKEVLDRSGIDAESLLQAGVIVPKELKQQATLNYQRAKSKGATGGDSSDFIDDL